MANSSSKQSCYLSCIQRACKEFKGIRVSAVDARYIPHSKFTIYALYIEDTFSGRSWVVLRRYSEIHEMRRRIKGILEHMINNTNCIASFEHARYLIHELDMLKFPGKFNLNFSEQKKLASRAYGFHAYIQGLMDIIGLENNSIQFNRSRSPIIEIKSILIGFLGGSNHNYVKYTYQIPDAIPQLFLTPENRVAVSKCRNLETVIENDSCYDSIDIIS